MPGEDNLDVAVFLSQIFDRFNCLLKEKLGCLFEPSMHFAFCAIRNVVVNEARFEIFLPIFEKSRSSKNDHDLILGGWIGNKPLEFIGGVWDIGGIFDCRETEGTFPSL